MGNEIIPVTFPVVSSDFLSAHEWRIPHERIEPAMLNHDFGELQRPVERRLTTERPLCFLLKCRQIAVVEMHGHLDRRIVPGPSLVGSGACGEFGGDQEVGSTFEPVDLFGRLPQHSVLLLHFLDRVQWPAHLRDLAA